MSLSSLIADTRKAVADEPANAQALFTAQGTLVGVTEVDIRTGAHSFKVDEPPALGGADVAANPPSTEQLTITPALTAYKAANNGQYPTNPSDLLPYLTTPEQQAALQKLEKEYPDSK